MLTPSVGDTMHASLESSTGLHALQPLSNGIGRGIVLVRMEVTFAECPRDELYNEDFPHSIGSSINLNPCDERKGLGGHLALCVERSRSFEDVALERV